MGREGRSFRGISERIRFSRRWTLQKLSQSLVCQMVHTSAWSLQEVVPAREILWAVLESLNEDIQTKMKLKDCASVEMRNGEVSMEYVKDGEVVYTPLVEGS